MDTSPQEAGETHVPMNAEAAEVAGSHTGRVATYILTEVPSAVHQGHRMGVVGTYLVVAFDRSIHQSQAPLPWEVHPCDASLCDQASFKVFGCLQRRASIEANRMELSSSSRKGDAMEYHQLLLLTKAPRWLLSRDVLVRNHNLMRRILLQPTRNLFEVCEFPHSSTRMKVVDSKYARSVLR